MHPELQAAFWPAFRVWLGLHDRYRAGFTGVEIANGVLSEMSYILRNLISRNAN